MTKEDKGGKLSPDIRTKCEVWTRLKFLQWATADV